MPNGVEEQGGGQLELGLVASVVDEASRPARDVATGLQSMFDWFERLARQGRQTVDDFIGTLRGDDAATNRTVARIDALRGKLKDLGKSIQDAITAPFRAAGNVINKFFNRFTLILGTLGTAVLTFFAFRNLKRELDEIFEATVKLEEQFVKIANFTGSEQFASNIIGWAEEMSLKVPIATNALVELGSQLALIGVQAEDINLEGLVAGAAAEGRDPAQFIKDIGQAVRDGRILELFEGFRTLPPSLAAGAVALGRFDLTGRVRALSDAFGTFVGPEAVDRLRNSVTGIRQLIANTFTVLRQTILGKPGEEGLFEVLRERMQFFLETLQRNRPLLQAVGETIGNILTQATRAFNRLLVGVLDRFGLRVADVGERVAVLQRRVLEPLQVAFAALITLLERALTGTSGFVDFIIEKFREFQPILKLIGGGLVAFGIVTGNPFLVAAGVALFIAGSPAISAKITEIVASAATGEGIEGITRTLGFISGAAALALVGFGVATGNILLIGAGLVLGGTTVAAALAFARGQEGREGVEFQEGREAQRLGQTLREFQEEAVGPLPPNLFDFLAQQQQQPIVINVLVDETADPQKAADTAAALIETVGSMPRVSLGTELAPILAPAQP